MQASHATVSSHEWRALSGWPVSERPPGPWSWLMHKGSLTGRLRQFTGERFHVQVLKQTTGTASQEDASVLGLQAGSVVHLREVYLCGETPLVFGQTLAPDGESARWLEALGNQPLGDRVFADQAAVRGEIEAKQVTVSDTLYRDAVQGLVSPPPSLWARRSLLRVQTARLLIYEAFLPGVND